ncbi:hypothetical protein Tco_0835207, partial [Tanacetum coccineum]
YIVFEKDVHELYEKYGEVFKETVLLEEEQVHVDDFHLGDGEKVGTDVAGEKQTSVKAKDVVEDVVNEPQEDKFEEETFTQWIKANIEWVREDDLFVWLVKVQSVNVQGPETPQRMVTRSSPKKRVSKPSAYLSSPYMNKKTEVIALVVTPPKSDCNRMGDKLETVFQTRTRPDVSFMRLNMETLAPRLWIDANVVDCWVAILNHEELVKVDPSPKKIFFTTGCIAMIERHIKEAEQWNMFSAKIFSLKTILLQSLFQKLNWAKCDPANNVVENQEGDAVKNVVENQEGDAMQKRK